MPDILYVVCHGLISLIRRKDGGFSALMIEMDGHNYLAGTWLNERPIAAGEFELTGVTDDQTGVPPEMLGLPRLDPARNIVLKVEYVPEPGSGVRTIIRLPPPIAVHSYYSIEVGELLEGSEEVLASVSGVLSGVQVLVYAVPGLQKPELPGHPWSPTPGRLKSPEPGISVLHLFNEPGVEFLDTQTFEAQAQHNLDEFEKGAKILGADLRLNGPAVALPSDDESLLPGLLRLELQPLAFRERVVKSVTEALFSEDADPIGTDPATCNAPHGDENGDGNGDEQ